MTPAVVVPGGALRALTPCFRTCPEPAGYRRGADQADFYGDTSVVFRNKDAPRSTQSRSGILLTILALRLTQSLNAKYPFTPLGVSFVVEPLRRYMGAHVPVTFNLLPCLRKSLTGG